MYSQSHGKVTGLARGGRKGNERMYSSLVEVEAPAYPPKSDGHGLWNFARPEISHDWRSLASDIDQLPYAFCVLELMDQLMGDHEPQPEIYSALTASLDTLGSSSGEECSSVLLWFILQLADLLGYSLQYLICPRCDEPLIFPVGGLVSSAGGILCARCTTPGSTPLDELTWTRILELSESDIPVKLSMPLAHRERLLTAFVSYLSYHSDKSLRLKSLELL
jgi:DNA repair protein RecO